MGFWDVVGCGFAFLVVLHVRSVGCFDFVGCVFVVWLDQDDSAVNRVQVSLSVSLCVCWVPFAHGAVEGSGVASACKGAS